MRETFLEDAHKEEGSTFLVHLFRTKNRLEPNESFAPNFCPRFGTVTHKPLNTTLSMVFHFQLLRTKVKPRKENGFD